MIKYHLIDSDCVVAVTIECSEFNSGKVYEHVCNMASEMKLKILIEEEGELCEP